MATRQVLSQLANGFEERQALNIADRAADLDQHEVHLTARLVDGGGQDEALDLIGDVGNDLHGRAQIIAPAFFLQNGLVDAASGDVVTLVGRNTGKALIVTQIEVGLGPVIGDEHFAVLIGRHRARIDIEIGIKLAQANAIATCLQQRTKSGGGEAFS